MDTQKEKQKVESLSNQITDNAAEILQALDHLHVKIAQGEGLERDLREAVKNVSSVPNVIRLNLFELDNLLQNVFNRAYTTQDEQNRAELAERGIVNQDWRGEFLGTTPIVR